MQRQQRPAPGRSRGPHPGSAPAAAPSCSGSRRRLRLRGAGPAGQAPRGRQALPGRWPPGLPDALAFLPVSSVSGRGPSPKCPPPVPAQPSCNAKGRCARAPGTGAARVLLELCAELAGPALHAHAEKGAQHGARGRRHPPLGPDQPGPRRGAAGRTPKQGASSSPWGPLLGQTPVSRPRQGSSPFPTPCHLCPPIRLPTSALEAAQMTRGCTAVPCQEAPAAPLRRELRLARSSTGSPVVRLPTDPLLSWAPGKPPDAAAALEEASAGLGRLLSALLRRAAAVRGLGRAQPRVPDGEGDGRPGTAVLGLHAGQSYRYRQARAFTFFTT